MKNLVNTFFRENFLLTSDTKVKYWSYSMSPDLLFETLRKNEWPAFHQKKNMKLFDKSFSKTFKNRVMNPKVFVNCFLVYFALLASMSYSQVVFFGFYVSSTNWLSVKKKVIILFGHVKTIFCFVKVSFLSSRRNQKTRLGDNPCSSVMRNKSKNSLQTLLGS